MNGHRSRASGSTTPPDMPYVPKDFWADYGPHHDPKVFGPWDPDFPDVKHPDHILTELAISETLLNHHVQPRSIFEVGCGYGRMALYFERRFPGATYTAIDLGEDQVASTKRLRPDANVFQADLLAFDVDALYDDPAFQGYELVVASEVLMHIRPEDLDDAYSQLEKLTAVDSNGRILLAEWRPEEKPRGVVASWNFPHNYNRLVARHGGTIIDERRANRQVVYLIRP